MKKQVILTILIIFLILVATLYTLYEILIEDRSQEIYPNFSLVVIWIGAIVASIYSIIKAKKTDVLWIQRKLYKEKEKSKNRNNQN